MFESRASMNNSRRLNYNPVYLTDIVVVLYNESTPVSYLMVGKLV